VFGADETRRVDEEIEAVELARLGVVQRGAMPHSRYHDPRGPLRRDPHGRRPVGAPAAAAADGIMLVQAGAFWMGARRRPPLNPNDAVPKTSVGKFDKKVLRERDKTWTRGRRRRARGVSWSNMTAKWSRLNASDLCLKAMTIGPSYYPQLTPPGA